MNPKTLAEAKRLFDSVKMGIKNIKNTEVVICPPYTQFSIFNLQLSKNLKLGAQDVFWENSGAYTGEISPLMLKDAGVQYVIIGHSERRRNLNETDKMVSKKLKAVLDAGLKPILCVGSETRDQKKEFKEVKIQLERAFSGIKKPISKNLIITYEPVWAISTTKGSKIATPKEAKEGADFIRKILIKLFNENLARGIRIIYGGSMDSKNIRGFIKETRIDGALIGVASLDSQEFVRAVKNASNH